jgi:hypothetical protein
MARNPVNDPNAWGALKQAPGVIIRMKIIQPMAYGKLYNWYAVMGITVAERSTHASRNRCKKTISPVGTFLVMGMDDINYFRGNADNGGKMKEREKHWKTPNADATTAVVLQLFREGIMDQWFILRHWRTRLLGVLRRTPNAWSST